MEITGMDQLKTAVTNAGPYAKQALAAAMFQEMDSIIAEAKSLTPVDTGVLQASGSANPTVVMGTMLSVDGGFGGAAASYVIPVHEHMTAVHPVGQAKFLEQPFLARVPTVLTNLSQRVATAWQRLAK